MKTMTIVRCTGLALVLLMSATTTRTQGDRRRDGNWWIELTPAFKLSYIVGFYDGMELGNRFSIWEMTVAKDSKAQDAVQEAVSSYAHLHERYMNHVTNGQLTEGLDRLYSDYRNRRISMDSGVWIVLNTIAGTPEGELQTLIENSRKNAVPPATN